MTTAVKVVSHLQKVIRKGIVARQDHSVPASTLSVHIAPIVAIQSTTKMEVSALKALEPGFRTRLRSVLVGLTSPVRSKAATALGIIIMTARVAISLARKAAIALGIITMLRVAATSPVRSRAVTVLAITMTARVVISPVRSKAAIAIGIITMMRVAATSPVRSKAVTVLAIIMTAREATSLARKVGAIRLMAVTSLAAAISLVRKAAISLVAVISRVAISLVATVRIRPTMIRTQSTA